MLRGRLDDSAFRAVADLLPALVWVADPDGGFTYVNGPWRDFTGRSLEEEAGCGWSGGVHPEDRGLRLEEHRRAFRDRAGFRLEYRLRRADGEYRWLVDVAEPRWAGGEFAGFVGACVDITEHRQTLECLRAALAEQRGAAERERRRLKELDHRVRNNLAGLLGLIGLYERSGRGPAELACVLREKVRVITEAHRLVMASPGGVAVADLVGLAAGDAAVDRGGPEVRLCPAQACALALVVAELISNSRRHGALSREGGRVRVSWGWLAGERGEGGGRLELACEDVGGVRPREVTVGVGLRLAEELARVDLRGSLRVGAGEEGVRCELLAAVDDVQKDGGQDEGR